MTNKNELSDNIEHLMDFMTGAVARHSFIENWNSAREAAKNLFTASNIARLDGSGFIKQFHLRSN